MMSGELTVNISSMSYPSSGKFVKPVNTIENLSFTAPVGSFISILGPSGAGKTTLLRIVAGLEKRYEGQIKLGAESVIEPSRNIQIVFQDYRLLPWKTVLKNIEFAAAGSGHRLGKDVIENWLRKVRLSNKKKSWPKDLSGGEEGRVAFARTFIDPPKVLLLDEPFRNLDLVTKHELQDILLETMHSHSMIVLMVSHNIDDALFFSDTIYLMSDSPMNIKDEFKPEGDRPRNRNDKNFRNLSEEITNRLLNSKKET